MTSMVIDTDKIRSLTEIEDGWKIVSPNLLAAYNGLHPDSLSKLAYAMFHTVIHNKMNIKRGAPGYKEDEARRIYSNTLCQPSELALCIHPAKYSNGETTDNDVANIIKRMYELEKLNIFYIWIFKKPTTYIYIMERYIDSWKHYNKNGVLSVKSFKKILSSSKQLIDTMLSLEEKKQRVSTKEEVSESYGFFINELIEKMNKDMSKSLTRFSKGNEIFSYISTLNGELKTVEKDDKVEYDEEFIRRLPPRLRNKIIKSHKVEKIEKGEKVNTSFDLSEIIPQNPNLTKIKKDSKKRDIAMNILKSKEPSADEVSFDNDDPFKNPTSFLKFYMALLRMYNSKVKFYSFVSELREATGIMDLLLINNRNNSKFLKAWIRYYFTNHLTGNNVYKEDKTCLKSFGETFNKYNGSYIG